MNCTKLCRLCHEILIPRSIVSATGHTEVIDKAVTATCQKTGLTNGSHCSTCKTVIVAQKETSRTAHVYKNNYKCGCGLYCEDSKIVVLSQNVRYSDDGLNKNISDRAPRFKQLVEKYSPDLSARRKRHPPGTIISKLILATNTAWWVANVTAKKLPGVNGVPSFIDLIALSCLTAVTSGFLRLRIPFPELTAHFATASARGRFSRTR